jgi:hypothetical protein
LVWVAEQKGTTVRRVFAVLNKFFMVPLFRLGLGPVFGNPISGYIMVLKVIGRKTGRRRYVPVNYAMRNGFVYCLVGFGAKSPWYLNLMAQPDIELILPTGAIYGHVEDVTDPAERVVVVRQVLKNSGFATLFEGLNPYRASDEALRAKTADQPLLRIRPTGIGNGPSDPGGLAWVWSLLVPLAIVAVLVLALR